LAPDPSLPRSKKKVIVHVLLMSFGCDRDMISIGRLDLVVFDMRMGSLKSIRAVSKLRSSQVVGLHIAESDWVQAASFWILKKS